MQPRRLIVAITGASGSIYGVRLLEMLAKQSRSKLLQVSKKPVKGFSSF